MNVTNALKRYLLSTKVAELNDVIRLMKNDLKILLENYMEFSKDIEIVVDIDEITSAVNFEINVSADTVYDVGSAIKEN